jgi:erythronate-4-phosphate dehydrogenase
MKIVCATNMPGALEAFGTLGEAHVLEGRALRAADVRDADLLAIRSTTRVNRELLEGSAVRFVGTATIGTDHMDIPYLESRGIHWCYAPGCNAISVSEYVAAALLCLGRRHGFRLEGLTIGVVGVGQVGSRVARKAETLGMRVLLNDPPRQRAEGGTAFVGLAQVLAEADVMTLHVPLTREGPDATWHLADEAFFRRAKPHGLFINSARGAVVRTDALLDALRRGGVAQAVVDTWEGEPRYRKDLCDRAAIATPHIAGHSFDGRVMGTVMVYHEACRFLGRTPAWTPDAYLPPPPVPEIRLDAGGREEEAVLWDAVRAVYDIEADDRRFRESSAADEGSRAARFDELRRTYPVRREFRFTRVHLRNASRRLQQKATGLGFQVELETSP